MEDWKNKYEVALVNAERAYKNADESGKRLIESMFPQFRESEDERIRKQCIKLLRASYTANYNANECIAWLEKQKELPFVKDVVLGYPGLYFYDGERLHFQGNPAMEEKQKEQKAIQFRNEKEYVRILKSIIADFIRDKKPEDVSFYQQIYDWLDGRHIEQKPVEWSKEDEIYLSQAIETLEHENYLILADKLKSLRPQQKPAEWSEEDEIKLASLINYFEGDALDYSLEDMARWLKSLPKRFNLQPKQEWSEEDLERLPFPYQIKADNWKPAEWSEDIIQKAVKEVGLTQHQINWFRNNVFPPKQEWSEEDEKNLHHCIEIVGGWEVDYDNANPHYSTWLKSLRPQPHWKPLPEQLEALMYAIEGKWDMINPTSYLSRMLEDLYDGLVNTYNVDENSEYIYSEDKN